MASFLRPSLLRTTRLCPRTILPSRGFSTLPCLLQKDHNLHDPPKGQSPRTPGRSAPSAPSQERENLRTDREHTYLGTTKRLPEFNLLDRVVLISGGARGLGLTQAEALLEAGATVYALDRLPEPSPDFYRVQTRAAEELGTTLHYRQIDVRDEEMLGEVVAKIGDEEGRMDGLIAAAGIQQETPALEYSAKDANTMFEINITGTFMTSKAVARQMIRFGNGGSMVLIASMSGSVANRVRLLPLSLLLLLLLLLLRLRPRTAFFISRSPGCIARPFPKHRTARKHHINVVLGSHLPSLQCLQSRRDPAGAEPGVRMGPVRDQGQHHIAGVHRDGHGGGAI